MNRKIFLYVKALSDFGMFMDLIVLNVLIYASTGSTAWLAATMAARTIGGVVSSLFSGIIADRFNRRKIMIISDIVRALIIIVLIPFPNPTMIIIVSFLIGFVNSSFAVSFSAEIPQIFGQKKILETNSIISRLTSISLVTGFIASGIITEFLGYKMTLLIDAFTYILSAVVLIKLKWETQSNGTQLLTEGMKAKLVSVWTDIKEVNKYLLLAPMLMAVNIVFLIGAFAGSSHNLGIPLLAEALNPDRQSYFYGMIWGVWGVGSVIATYFLPKLKWLRDEKVYYACFISAMLMSTGFIVFLSSMNLWIIFAFAIFTGIFDASFTTLHATLLQKSDNYIRGRIFGVGMLLKSLGFAGGFVIAPMLLEVMTMPQLVWLLHGSLITSTIAITVIVYSRRARTKNIVQSKNA
ncbi:MFS transporter [Robertmurraya mangrovi]|nr:MFS transporter [Bacillus sp. 31A1R]